jgi:saccharopine dehydrogenase (NAD+, L-lysine-forming)
VKVAVLGAAGTVAPAIVRDLAESEECSSLLLLDRDGPGAEAVAARHGAGKASTARVDARDGLAEALDGCQVLVNAASYRINLEAMEAALTAGCHYVDLGGLYWMTARQIELDERFIEAELLAVIGMGASPGQTNVMAERVARELGEKVTEMHVSVATTDPAPPAGDGLLRLPYALRTLIDELTMPAIVIEDACPRKVAPLSPGGTVAFPDPVGPVETIFALHSELQTFTRSFGLTRASFRLGLPPELRCRLEALLGIGDDELAAAAAAALPPSDQAVAAHVVAGRSAGRTALLTAVTRPIEAWGMGGGIVSVAAPAAAVVRLIARGRIEPVGVCAPEMCVDPDDLIPELEQRGCTFVLEVRDRSLPA